MSPISLPGPGMVETDNPAHPGELKPAAGPEEAWRPMAVSTAACALFGLLGATLQGLLHQDTPAVVFYALAYMAGGWEASWEALRALKRGKLEVDLLMVAAALGAAFLGHWAEGTILLFLFSLGNTLEDFAFGRTRRSIQGLMELRPETASMVTRDGEARVSIGDMTPGQVVRVRPGERIPVDGEVVAGESPVDESTLTGEAVPLRKHPGDEVFAGTLNTSGTLDVRITRPAEETTLARVIQMVEEAQEAQAPAQGWIERAEGTYAAVILVGALLAILIPYFLLGWDFQDAFYRAMTLLVVASPCALVISIPATIVSAVSNGARNGVLFKGGAHLDALAGIRVMAFDKTGTLTQGRPEVAGFFHLLRGEDSEGVMVSPEVAQVMTRLPARVCPVVGPPQGPSGHCPGITSEDEDFLRLVAGLESRSEHHVAQAVLRGVEAMGLSVPEPRTFDSFPGRGVEGKVEGIQVAVGRRDWIEEKTGKEVPGILLRWLEEGGRKAASPIFVAADGAHVGALVLADQPRIGAREALAALKEGGVDQIVMITGDTQETAESVAGELGIDRVFSRLLPHEKSQVLEELRQEFGSVAMVGDGVNDAPALAAADVGIALGAAGTDVALETADVVIMGEELTGIPYAQNLSRRARGIVLQNLIFASGVILILVTLALTGNVSLPAGVVGHEGSTIVVIFNGLRLLRQSSGGKRPRISDDSRRTR